MTHRAFLEKVDNWYNLVIAGLSSGIHSQHVLGDILMMRRLCQVSFGDDTGTNLAYADHICEFDGASEYSQ